MPEVADWKAALHRNPRDAALWEIVGDWLSDGNEWEREKCQECNGCGWVIEDIDADSNPKCSDCHGSGSLPTLTAHRARLTAWRLRMEDERWHGKELCPECFGDEAQLCNGPCGGTGFVPTFALLWDQEGEEITECSRCSGEFCDTHFANPCKCNAPDRHCWEPCELGEKRIIPGHVNQLASYMEREGDGRAARVRGVRVVKSSEGSWAVEEPAPNGGTRTYNWKSYSDACREAIRRIVEVFTKPCPCSKSPAIIGHKHCFGLGWRATEV